MGKIKQIHMPDEIIVAGNARMWYSIFKAMTRKEFTEYPNKIRSFDDMSVAEYYAYKRMARARDDDKVWDQIQKTTEGYPATEGTIQRDQGHAPAYLPALEEEDRRPGMTQAEIHGKIESHKEEPKNEAKSV